MDVKLIQQAIKGNQDACVLLLQHHQEVLYRIAYSYLRNEPDTLDAIQEVTIRCLTRIHTLKEPTYFKTWLIRILLNVCADLNRKKQRTLPVLQEKGYEEEVHIDLYRALDELKVEQRELIYLKYFEDYQNKQIAEQLQLPEGTVKSRLHTILKKMRKRLGGV